jgi:hypothetical protein
MAMDDAGLEMLRREELRLIKTFLRITDSSKRRRILDLVEQLAENAAVDAAESGPANTPAAEECRDTPGRIE